ncbi:MAG TPA: hypothetical protein VIS07_10835 [Candidatus Binatia bacterium]
MLRLALSIVGCIAFLALPVRGTAAVLTSPHVLLRAGKFSKSKVRAAVSLESSAQSLLVVPAY